ncbi:MAG: hypothetical protein HYY86_02845 [Candidatus Harrisonbacteria bacterium]|nr:hypothetical protein [Candidatus Harrisonbacteria bacterium]
MAARREKPINLGSAAFRNRMRLELLIRLPQFQKEAVAIRQQFNIPSSGIITDEQMANWQRALNEKEDNLKFGNQLEQLGRKFKLPYHLINLFGDGLRAYILKNKIVPPVYNFVIEHQPKSGEVDYLSIKTFALLDKEEIKLALNDLKNLQKLYFSKETTLPIRSRKQFKRDLVIFDKLIKRIGNPVRRKDYLPSSFLVIAKKSGTYSPKKLRGLEKEYKKDVVIRYNQVTAREIAKELKTTAGAVGNAFKRIKKLIKQWFDIDINGQQ